MDNRTESLVVLEFPLRGKRACGVADVERLNQYAVYHLGCVLKEVTAFTGDVHPAQAFSQLMAAENALTRLLADNPFPIHVSRGPAQNLLQQITHLLDENFRPPQPDGKKGFVWPESAAAPIPAFWWDWLRQYLHGFETVFNEEMRDAAIYRVPRRGIYWTPALVDAADETFPSEVVGIIPDKTKVEWRAAGRCLAFNLLTASGFHVARAVEGTIETYYQTYCNQPGRTLNGWQDYINALEKVIKAGTRPAPSPKTLAELVQMKRDYRNPIAHPRVVLDEPGARMLFANGESVIIAMAQELTEAAKSGGQTSLQLVSQAAGTTP